MIVKRAQGETAGEEKRAPRDENADLGRSGKLKMVAVTQLIAVVVMLLVTGTVETQEATTSVTEAKSLVDIVLRHQGFPLSSQYCEIANLDKEGQPFAADYYSFGASCDFPNTAATSSWGIYFVSPRSKSTNWRRRADGSVHTVPIPRTTPDAETDHAPNARDRSW